MLSATFVRLDLVVNCARRWTVKAKEEEKKQNTESVLMKRLRMQREVGDQVGSRRQISAVDAQSSDLIREKSRNDGLSC